MYRSFSWIFSARFVSQAEQLRTSANGALAKRPVRHCTRYGFLDDTVCGQYSSVCASFFLKKGSQCLVVVTKNGWF